MMTSTPLPRSAATSVRPAPRWPRLFNPTTLVALLVAAVLLFLVANPISQLVLESFRLADRTGYTLDNYITAFSRWRYFEAFLHSIQLGLVAVLFSALIAVPLAWSVSRTNMPWRKFIHLTVLLSFLIPPYVGAIGWILLGGKNAGWLNGIWTAITGAETGPIDIFTFWGLAFVIGLYTFPLIYVFTKSALDLISTELEEAAAILGAPPMQTTLRVTLPLALPAIVGSTLLVFLEILGLFGTVALIGIPAGYNVVTTQLAAFFEYPTRVEVAAAFAMPLVFITILLLSVQKLLLQRKGYVTVTGKGGHREPLKLGAWRWVLLGFGLVVAALGVFLPMYVIIQSAFSKGWSLGWSLDNFTLHNFEQALFVQETIRQSLFNTLNYALAAATVCTVLGFAIAYIEQRKLIPFAGALSAVTLAPFAIPGIVLAICFYAAYAPPPMMLYGTGTIIVIAFVTRFLPISFVNSKSAIQGLHPELEEAVRVAGGHQGHSLRHVVLPILKKSLFGSWLLIFVIATRELSTAMFLSGPETRVLSVLTIDMSEEGRYEILSAIAVLLLFVTGVVCLIGTRLIGRDFMLRRT